MAHLVLALESWKSFNIIQKLSSPPFTIRAGDWPLILKLGRNIEIWSGRTLGMCPNFCVTWLWSWQKRQLWRVDGQSCTGLIYFLFVVDNTHKGVCIFTRRVWHALHPYVAARQYTVNSRRVLFVDNVNAHRHLNRSPVKLAYASRQSRRFNRWRS